MWHTLALVLRKLHFFWDPSHKKVDVYSIQQMSCQQSLQGKGHNFLINSAWSTNMEPLVLQNTALPRCHGLNSGSVLHHSNLPIRPLSWPHRLLRSVKSSFKCMFSFPRNHFLSITKAPYILSLPVPAKLIVDPCFGSWNRNLTCFSFLKLVSSFLNFRQRFTKTNIQTLATEIFNL